MNVDNRPKPPSQQKLAEKLIILNERAQGLLTRLHYSKQVIISLGKLIEYRWAVFVPAYLAGT